MTCQIEIKSFDCFSFIAFKVLNLDYICIVKWNLVEDYY